jgi:hypothetical protein
MIALVATFALTVSKAQNNPNGMSIFRYDTFGDEQLWTDTLQMQHVIKNVGPATALSVGLKVDSDALPPELINAIKAGADLNDPAITIQLLKLNAVVGVIGKVVGANDNLATIGVTCALCHSTVGRWITPWCRASENAATVGRIWTSTSARSSRSHPRSRTNHHT